MGSKDQFIKYLPLEYENNFWAFKAKYLTPYSDIQYEYEPALGWIVWRLGTGENIELLHIRSHVVRKGHGRVLFYRMLSLIEKSKVKPYHSIFGFTRVSNLCAKEFYTSVGFNIQPIDGLYKDGSAIMFWQEYTELLKRREERYVNLLHREAQQPKE